MYSHTSPYKCENVWECAWKYIGNTMDGSCRNPGTNAGQCWPTTTSTDQDWPNLTNASQHCLDMTSIGSNWPTFASVWRTLSFACKTTPLLVIWLYIVNSYQQYRLIKNLPNLIGWGVWRIITLRALYDQWFSGMTKMSLLGFNSMYYLIFWKLKMQTEVYNSDLFSWPISP